MTRKQKDINRANITKEILKDPLADQRTIAKRAGVSKTSVHNHSKELDQDGPKSKAIEEIIEKDAQIVKIAQQVILDRLNNPEKEKTRDIISASDVSSKRYSMFKGDITDDEGGLKAGLTDKQQEALDSILSIINNGK